MRELGGLSYSEIGLAIASTEAAARQAVYEARVGLRELNRGREMECETARRAVSERDGRLLRSRRLRAHLRACEACQGFHAAISQRRADLQVLSPPLPAVVASGLLSSVLGGAATGGAGSVGGALTGGGAAGVAGGTTLAGPIAVKGASLAAAVAIGAGAAGISGVVEVPVIGDRDAQPAPRSTATPATTDGGQAAGLDGARGHRETTPGRGRQGASAHPGIGVQGRPGARGEAGRHGGGGSGSNGTAPESSGAAGDLPASSNGKPPPHSSAGGDAHGQAGASAGAGSHGKPSAPPGLDNATSNAPSLPEQAHGKPGALPRRSAFSRAQGSASATQGSVPSRGSSGAHRPPPARGAPGRAR
jgi:hypothetical protein